MNNDRNKKIGEILGSLDGSQKAVVSDYFYTRLKARMQARLESAEKSLEPAPPKPWVLRPAFALTVLAAVLFINVFVILKEEGTKNDSISEITNDSDPLQSIAAEYSLNDNSYVYDLNQNK